VHVAYFVNQYPKVSHSFIRREILALERAGARVSRFAIRGDRAELVDPGDIEEHERTRYLLANGPLGLLAAMLRSVLRRPRRLGQTLAAAVRLGRRSQRGLLRHFAYVGEACLLLEWMQASSVEHLHAHFGTNPAAVAMFARMLGGPPYSFTVHGPDEFDDPKGLSLCEKIERSAFVVAVSSFGRSQLFRQVDVAQWPKVKVVHCGLDSDFLAHEASPLPAARRLVCVGRLCEQKGQLLLVQAASRLAAEGVDFHLVLAGDGPMRNDIEALIREHALQQRISITGWISGEQVREELERSRAMVLPSFAEGLPVVIMEAMAIGRPVLSTYVAGIPELVRTGEAGWLVEAGSVDALTGALRELLHASDEELARMGAVARIRVGERHSIDTEAAKLMEHFEARRSATA